MLEAIKQIIKNIKWDEKYKKSLIEVLPLVQDNYLKTIYTQLRTNGVDFIGESLTDAVIKCTSAQQKLQNGQENAAIEVLNTAPEYAWWENGNFVFGWYLDLNQSIKTKKINASLELHQALGMFAIKMIQSLNVDQVADILKNYLLVGLVNFHILMEIKNYVFKNDLIGNKKAFTLFINSLSFNDELIGKQNLIVEEKEVPPSIKNWIRDFYTWSPKGVGSLNIFQLVQYSKTSKNFTKLTSVEKEYVLEVLKVYIWLLSPNVSEAEITEFIQFKKDEALSKFNKDFLQFIQNQAKQSSYISSEPPLVPTPKKVVKEDAKVTSDPGTTANKLADYGAGELQVTSNTKTTPSPVEWQTNLSRSSLAPTTADIRQGEGVVPVPRIKPVNIEEIMKKGKNTPVSNQGPGLFMGGNLVTSDPGTTANKLADYGAGKLQAKSNKETTPSPNLSPQGRGVEIQTPDIDKKLQELEQKARPMK